MVMQMHPWDEIRARQTVLDREHVGFHESLFRSFAILEKVKEMLDRGDSTETISEFVEWAEGRYAE